MGMSKWYYLRKYVLNKILKMALQNLFIPSGMYFGVTDLKKNDKKKQKFYFNINPMLDSHLELLGRAIKINFKELFQ
jgi:hypothetical protein